MTRFALAVLAITALRPVAHAEEISNDPRSGAPLRSHKIKLSPTAIQPHSSIAVVPNANSCAPDQAEPVWGENGVLLGYSCVPPSANGG
jgi:hypothetical protein